MIEAPQFVPTSLCGPCEAQLPGVWSEQLNPAANLRCPPDINSGNFAIKVTRQYASPGIATGYSKGVIHGRTHESGIYHHHVY